MSRPFLSYAALVAQQTCLLRGLRFWLRCRLRPQTATKWLDFIESLPALAEAPRFVRAILADKIHRPFARCAFNEDDRVAFLLRHYSVAQRLFKPDALQTLVAGERLVLARLSDKKNVGTFVFTLSREMLSQHQGELTFLMIEEGSDIPPLAMLMINFGLDENGEPFLYINGIQGPGHAHKKKIVGVTRGLYGLRPKHALVEIAYLFAAWMKAEKLIAIAKDNHVSQTKTKWQRRVHAAYDPFWEEFGPQRLPDGDYEMPLPPPRRSEEDVVPKKRKDWRMKQVLLDSLREQTLAALSGIGRT